MPREHLLPTAQLSAHLIHLMVPTIINGSISAHLVVVSIAEDVILVDFDEQRIAVRLNDLCGSGGGRRGGERR